MGGLWHVLGWLSCFSSISIPSRSVFPFPFTSTSSRLCACLLELGFPFFTLLHTLDTFLVYTVPSALLRSLSTCKTIMRFFTQFTGAALLVLASTARAVDLDPESEESILAASKQYAAGLMALYQGGAEGTAIENVGIWPQPHYWWEGGAAWGGMIEYSMFTGDDSFTKTLQQALTANYGPANNFILDYRRSQTGNDDQAFWALAVMSALEYQFPDAENAPADYLDVAVNSFNNIMSRWDETSCSGGLKWQIYPENSYGYNYKNSISNGCAFALGARLARYTGNQSYADTATKVYDWSKKVGLVTDKFEVYDGAGDKENCAEKTIDKTQWTYNNAMYLHGSAFMFDFTKGDSTWKDRVSGFMSRAEELFFKPYDNATDIMFEAACETGETGRHCNLDQQSFKAYLSRFMAKTAIMAPFTKDTITKYLKASAVGAAKSCSGGADGKTCGSKWYTGAWDGKSGVGQQLSALEVTQALLMLKKGTVPAKKDASKPEPATSATPKPSSTPAASSAPSSSAPAPSSQAPSPAPSSQAPSSAPSPAPSSNAPAPAPPSDVPSFTFSPSSASPAPAPSASAPASSVTPAPVLPSAGPSNSTSVPAQSRSSVKPGGEFGEKPSSKSCTKSNGSSCTCTPSVTKTVYVPLVTKASTSCTPSVTTTVYVAPAVPTISGMPIPSASVNGSLPVPSPSQPLQFEGAAVTMKAAATAILAAVIVAAAAAL
ncbi:hypothetical protein HBI25_075620 [Parastagonospora nodorum]|nr:hypothetical protein HBI74_128150 [Parastagonospora nodorum]KAH5031663.1 hypothetical protein HBI75_112560 [Parastagonospora nodorum]KAH5167377.1 hypothetical protein HBI73_017200 [Parastagonospora nodorum]KAH5282641.1 hypothetical protein HBI70_063480 [Parastagonospora nodorum]KAH5433712.1 hypothetical protein HBI47_087080 [Parastagonospora nodorum]